ncbi:MAG: SDR family NAD(P)-dependent oxidoreductase [Pirellulaceae bacterium]|nr:SDR family NAD(P)-dependent oxidoreductase [Pirellulaceae bacterium]
MTGVIIVINDDMRHHKPRFAFWPLRRVALAAEFHEISGDLQMQLTNNTIFITGGGSGIGRGLAEALHRLGNQVIISGRRQQLLDQVTAANPGMKSICFDVSSARETRQAVDELLRKFPSLNVLINNAGIMPLDDPSSELTDSDIERVTETNFVAPIRLTSYLIEHLKAQPRSTILYNTSILAFVPLASAAVYSATKAALHSYVLSQRFALRDSTVTVQEIAPPWVDTDLIVKSGDPRAMPLEMFIDQIMKELATDAEDLLVEAIRPMRDNPGANEHAFVHGFNLSLIENPIPTGV